MAEKYVWLNDKGHVIGNKNTVCYTEQCPCYDRMWCPGIKIIKGSIKPNNESCRAEYEMCFIVVEVESESGQKIAIKELLKENNVFTERDLIDGYDYFVVEELVGNAGCAACHEPGSNVCFPGIDSSFSFVTLDQLYRAALYEIEGVEWQVPTSFMPQTLEISCHATDNVTFIEPGSDEVTNNIINNYEVSYYVKNDDGFLQLLKDESSVVTDNKISIDGSKYHTTGVYIPQFISVENERTDEVDSKVTASELCFNNQYQDTWQFRLTAKPVTSGFQISLNEGFHLIAWYPFVGVCDDEYIKKYTAPTTCALDYYTKYVNFATTGKLFSISFAGGSNTQEKTLDGLPVATIKPSVNDKCIEEGTYVNNAISGTLKLKLTSEQIVTITGSDKSRTLKINEDYGTYSIKVEKAIRKTDKTM